MTPRTRSLTLAVAAAFGLAALPLLAEGEMDHSTMPMTGMETPATLAYMDAMMQMHQAMTISYTGNPDVDFIAGMIPHHQGAVEMAKIVLEHGTDPEVRKLAEGIIAAQESEIAWMTDWLARHPAN